MNDVRGDGPVVFFDGDCILCNGFADFVMRRDRRHALRLATLQGETAASLLPDEARRGTVGASVILYDAAGVFRKSEAVRRVLGHMGGPWRAAAFLIGLVPRRVRDAAYDVVARHRLRWFGRRATCRMPTPEERGRLLP